jgi:two-component system, chemotaxis family, sensor kinase CheA
MSTETGRKFFEQFIDDYFVECEEHLSSARRWMLQLEKPESAGTSRDSVLDQLLRDFHSMKGLSAMVGVEEVTQISHHIEDYLRELKQPKTEVTASGIAQVVTGINTIEQVLNSRRKSEPAPDITGLLLLLTGAAEDVRHKPQSQSRPVNGPAAESAEGSEGKWHFEFRPSPQLAAQGVTVSTIRERLESFGKVTHASPRVLADGGVVFDFTLIAAVSPSRFQALSPHGVVYTPIVEAAPAAEAPSATPTSVIGSSNVIRVDMGRLDDLMRVVGELVISRFHFHETLEALDQEMSKAGLRTLHDIDSVLERQVRELREAVIRTRMVSIGQIFERMRFVVRGLERDTGKKVHVVTSGQDTELDKVIVEKMMDPLLHLVRNSISHGIETPEQRLAAGKPAEGTVRLSAATVGDTVLVEVEDDGQGLDIERVTARARSLGMLGGSEVLDTKRLLEVISAPGFTTRDAADLASGRGVGMADVQSTVRDLGGIMTLQTTRGKGTRFSIQLPLTLAITDALLVTVERQRFAVPQANVREVFAVESSAITPFEGNELVTYRDGVLPILRLSTLFRIKTKPRKRLHVLVIGTGSAAVGIVVDRITGHREVVVRSVADPLLRTPGVSGATELGDGQLVLILDVHELMKTNRTRAAENRP